MKRFSGAVNQIRTGDLVLTKDVLYRLSHNSRCHLKLSFRVVLRDSFCIIAWRKNFVKRFLKKTENYFQSTLQPPHSITVNPFFQENES